MIERPHFTLQDANNAKRVALAFNLKKLNFEFDVIDNINYFYFKNDTELKKAKYYAEVLIDIKKEPEWKV